MALVVLSGLLSLHPLLKAVGKRIPNERLTVALFYLLYLLGIVLFFVYGVQEFLDSWLALPGRWWKLVLGGEVF